MAKKVNVTFPRSAVLELKGDALFGLNLSNAILAAENYESTVPVAIGKGRKKALVTIEDPNIPSDIR
jgi:hypothetical protein